MTKAAAIPVSARYLTVVLMVVLQTTSALAWQGDLVRVKNLEGDWKFSIGEREEWVGKNLNDADWETIHVPTAWEDQGFYGYNGYATYRKTFTMPGSLKGKNLYLVLGYIDDVDETYVNGHKIGSTGSFPPSYNTAYNAKRVYAIPEEIINFDGLNTIAVVVYDSYQYGGIVKGEVGIYANPNEVPVDINLQGTWKFKTGDDLEWKSGSYRDNLWEEIFVPAKWEDQGFRDYDGYAWYRKTFYYKGGLNDTKIILMLGKIDDADEVFLNGVKIGSTGDFQGREYEKVETGDRYRALRGYYFDSSILKKDQQNTIAVRVYDSGGDGGIYQGPVGFITQTNYIRFWREKNRNSQ